MVLTQSDVLEVKKAPGKGRGVFARVDIAEGTVFERVPLLVFDTEELENSDLMDYVFIWGKKTVAIALGYGSIYNHSFSPNARYYDGPGRTKVFMALQDIKAGEEITVNYNGNPDSRDKVEFDVLENGNGSLNGHAAGSNGCATTPRPGSNGRSVNGNGRAVNGKSPKSTPVRASVTARSVSRTVKQKRRPAR